MDLRSGFKTGTIGAAHLEDFTGLMIPNVSNHCNSFSTISLITYGKGRYLQNFGATDGSM